MTPDPLVPQSDHDPTTCGCSLEWRKAKGNGTCATCGGWLPGEKPAPLPWLRDDLKRAGEQIKRHKAGH